MGFELRLGGLQILQYHIFFFNDLLMLLTYSKVLFMPFIILLIMAFSIRLRSGAAISLAAFSSWPLNTCGQLLRNALIIFTQSCHLSLLFGAEGSQLGYFCFKFLISSFDFLRLIILCVAFLANFCCSCWISSCCCLH